MGLASQSKPIPNAGGVINFILDADLQTIDEVVVVGYGTQKKVNLTGAVTSIKPAEIQGRTTTNVVSAIQGLVPGVTIINRPGEEPSVNFRGRGNLGKSEPLYVIDGIIVDASSFGSLDPSSIDNISFLKDAASASIYGSRAAYGVVLVTTRQGTAGKVQVNYNGLIGANMISYMSDFVDSWQYAELRNEAAINSGKKAIYTEEEIGWFRDGSKPDLYANSNWMELAHDKAALTTQHSVNFSGGTDKVNFFAVIGYLHNEKNLRNRADNRYNININVNAAATDWLTLRASAKFIHNNYGVNGGTPDLGQMLVTPMTLVNKHSNGMWGSVMAGQSSGTIAKDNPMMAYELNNWTRNMTSYGVYEGGFDITPIKNLVITGQGAFNTHNYQGKNYTGTREAIPSFLNPEEVVWGGTNTNRMNMDWRTYRWETYNARARYSFDKNIHSFSVMVGTSYEKYKFEKLTASRGGFPTDNMTDMSGGASSGAEYKNGSESYKYSMFSYFGRVNYSIMDRYLFEANMRADASSRFHKDHRWGYFPSASLGWRISEEAFMENTKSWLNSLKLRFTYGKLGNINNVGYYDYFANYGDGGYYPFDGTPGQSLAEMKPANSKLGWEKVTMYNAGLDFDFFNGKLAGTVEYYTKKTNDILLAYPVPSEVGIHPDYNPSQNLGKVKNSGVEFNLQHNNRIGDWSYSIGGNFSYNKNEVLDLSSGKDIIQDAGGHGVAKYIIRKGEAIGSFYGLRSDGLYTQQEIDNGQYYTYGGTKPNAGDIKYLPAREGVNYGDEITNDDRVIIGSNVPKYTYGVNLMVAWKGFELNVYGQGVRGAQVAFEVYQVHPFFHGNDNPRKYHLGRWTEENPNPKAIYPRIYEASDSHTTYNRAFNSDYSLFNANYFRLKTITLAYSLPRNLISNAGFSNVRFYLTGENLLTARGDKKMKDFDPETAGGVVQTLGNKTVAFGVNLSF